VRGRNNRDLCDVICGRHVNGRIGNRCQEQEHVEHEQCNERDFDYYGLTMTKLTDSTPMKEGIIQEESNLSSVT
jgi:hypothetical protein